MRTFLSPSPVHFLKCMSLPSSLSDLYKLVNGLKNVEKYGFYIFQSMLEINEIWYIIIIYNILSAQISSSPRAGRETFTNPNFPLRPPGPQIA